MMGLGFIGSDAHFSYGGFHHFRRKLAKEIGINLDMMQGFSNHHGNSPDLAPKTSWSEIKDSIKYFLNHSDCQGSIGPKRCKMIADRMSKLIKDWEDDWNKDQAIKLIKGMRECHRKNKRLGFC